jgi:hypothetical protein
MATSGTYAFTLDIADVIEEAYERIGKESRTGYDLQTARRSMDLMFLEWQNRGLNLWTVKNASLTMVPGQLAYPLEQQELDIVEANIRTNEGSQNSQTDIHMRRISISRYAQQTNKLTTGRPIQYWVEKAARGITLNVWPVPDATESYVVNYYYMCRVQDTGKPLSNDLDVPIRFLPVLVAGLAYYLALKTPDAADKIPLLEGIYEKQWNLAADSARNKASFQVTPGGYRNI